MCNKATNGQKINKIDNSEAGENIYTVISWRESDIVKGEVYETDYVVVSVLKRKTGNLIEVARTKALPQHVRLNFEAIENPSSSSFDIAFFQFTPLGRQTFHFIQRNNIWRVSGADCSSLYMNEEAGDEAVGDSSYDISINYLSGITSEIEYSGGKFKSKKKRKINRKIRPLAEFEIGCNY